MASSSPLPDPFDRLTELIRDERTRLARVARSEGLRAEDAVDSVHDAFCTFLRLAQSGGAPSADIDLPSFLATIVRNVARNKRRRHSLALPHEAIDSIEPVSDEPLAEALVARAEEHVRLRACVDRLCETQKAVVTLRLLEEERGEDVASLLGISRGYVDVLLHRAKAQLYACLTQP